VIRRHDFNSDWWGAPVGLVHDAGFFALAPEARRAALAPFAWAEWQDGAERVPATALRDAGFFWCDAQIAFRAPLRIAPEIAEFAADVEVLPLAADPQVSEIRPFARERFRALPGIRDDMITDRFRRWAISLRSAHPGLALDIRLGGQCQGWFFAEPGDGALRLTLAMLHRESRIGGLHLYAAALRHYAGLGHRFGHAAFSVANTEVLNMYARLGARFESPRQCYFWTVGGKC
jgi:hypothetical protein